MERRALLGWADQAPAPTREAAEVTASRFFS